MRQLLIKGCLVFFMDRLTDSWHSRRVLLFILLDFYFELMAFLLFERYIRERIINNFEKII